MSSKHKFILKNQGILKAYPGGARILSHLTHSMALGVIDLEKGGFREPHWHPNAQELTFCVEGKVLITLFSPQNQRETFTLSAGEVVFFPQGYIHHLENIFEGKSRLLLGYNHSSPEDLDLSSTIRSMTDNTLSRTFGSSEKTFETLHASPTNFFIAHRKTLAKPDFPFIASPHKFSLESTTAQIQTKAGRAHVASISAL
jgi:oxalate decarboxylase